MSGTGSQRQTEAARGTPAVVAYVAVGSNIQPEANIPAALDKLLCAVRVTASSTVYRTAALDRPDDPGFLNGVWKIETDIAARALKFDVLRRIEEELGRKRSADKYAPRTIDLDLLVYGDAAIAEPDLRVPDPDIRTRAFVALPLLELSPELVLGDTGERLAALPVLLSRPQLSADREMTEQLRAYLSRCREKLRRAGQAWRGRRESRIFPADTAREPDEATRRPPQADADDAY